MLNEYAIADRVPVRPNLVLAPMAGVTDSPFRRLIKELGGVGLIVLARKLQPKPAMNQVS